jgi:prepilin-type N-terminal cleavage/methylation domain-containing protein
MHTRSSQSGFTLIELSVVVSIIGFLSLVVIPGWFKETNKGKYDSEVNAMMSEIIAKEEQYKIEYGSYKATPTCPATPVNAGSGTDITPCLTSASWTALRMSPALSTLRCTYTITTGTPNTVASPGLTGVTFNGGPGYWYYVVATCDMDGKGGTNSSYLAGSTNTKIQKDVNYGK